MSPRPSEFTAVNSRVSISGALSPSSTSASKSAPRTWGLAIVAAWASANLSLFPFSGSTLHRENHYHHHHHHHHRHHHNQPVNRTDNINNINPIPHNNNHHLHHRNHHLHYDHNSYTTSQNRPSSSPSIFSSSSSFSFLVAFASAAEASYAVTPSPTDSAYATFGLTRATLLSGVGGLDECLATLHNPYCTAGLATALTVFRNITARRQSQHTEYIYLFDKDTAFVQMHPQGYGVNIATAEAFGIKYLYADPTMFVHRSSQRLFDFESDAVRFLQANLRFYPSDEWSNFIQRQAIFFNGTVGFMLVTTSAAVLSTDATTAMNTVLRYLKSRVPITVVVNSDGTRDGLAQFEGIEESLRPDVYFYPDATASVNTFNTCRLLGRSYVCGIQGTNMLGVHMHIYTDPMNASRVTGAAVECRSIVSIDKNMWDAQYFEQQAFLKAEALKAIAYDPTLAYAAVNMTAPGMFTNVYPCFKDECPTGTLHGRAMVHYVKGSHFSFGNAGAFRGNGWSVGAIKMSHVWTMNPFANGIAKVTMMGYTVWRIMNASAWLFNDADTYDTLADNFLQGDGFRVEIDATRPRFTNRLLSVSIRDPTTGVFEPLQRNKYYTVATDVYMVSTMPVFRAILGGALLRGESVEVSPDIVQTGVSQYLQDIARYGDGPTPLLHNNFVIYRSTDGDSASSTRRDASLAGREPMNWVQSEETCSNTQYWDGGILTCINCPSSQVRDPAGDRCIPAPEDGSRTRNLVLAIVLPIGIVLALVLIVSLVVVEYRRRRSVRNIDNAPRSGDLVTFVFTDIQSSTKLWGTVPASMAAALEIHHRVIRSAIAKHRGYEVKTIGDSFMIACSDVVEAASMCVSIQEGMLKEAWPIAIGQVYACEGEMMEADLLNVIDDEPRKLAGGGAAPNHEGGGGGGADVGVKVRIGINTGVAEAVFDEVSKGYDYYGPAVNTAARIEAAAQGGQILISRIAVNLLPPTQEYMIAHFAEVYLQGVSERMELLQLIPLSLMGRVFEPLGINRRALQDPADIANQHRQKQKDQLHQQNSDSFNNNNNTLSDLNNNNHQAGGGGATPNAAGGIAGAGPAAAAAGGGKQLANGGSDASSYYSRDHSSQSTVTDLIPGRNRYAIVCRESLTAVMRLVDPSTRIKLVEAIAKAWRINTLNVSSASGGVGGGAAGSASGGSSKNAVSATDELVGLISYRVSHVLRKRLASVGIEPRMTNKDAFFDALQQQNNIWGPLPNNVVPTATMLQQQVNRNSAARAQQQQHSHHHRGGGGALAHHTASLHNSSGGGGGRGSALSEMQKVANQMMLREYGGSASALMAQQQQQHIQHSYHQHPHQQQHNMTASQGSNSTNGANRKGALKRRRRRPKADGDEAEGMMGDGGGEMMPVHGDDDLSNYSSAAFEGSAAADAAAANGGATAGMQAARNPLAPPPQKASSSPAAVPLHRHSSSSASPTTVLAPVSRKGTNGGRDSSSSRSTSTHGGHYPSSPPMAAGAAGRSAGSNAAAATAVASGAAAMVGGGDGIIMPSASSTPPAVVAIGNVGRDIPRHSAVGSRGGGGRAASNSSSARST